jgi:hypothetical protein
VAHRSPVRIPRAEALGGTLKRAPRQRTPSFFKNVIIGHQFVNADWKRFRPTNAVK